MEKRDITCIACPVGCRLTVWQEDGAIRVINNSCKRGLSYGAQEYENPERTVTTSVRVAGGARPVCAVKTKTPIPKGKIGEILAIIKEMNVKAPIEIGQVLMENIGDTGVNLVATAAMEAR